MIEKPTRFEKESEYNATSKKTSGARMEFDTTGMRKFIDDRGLPVLWERSWYCTCRNTETLQPDPNCTICAGKGVAYDPATHTKLAIQSQEKGIMSMDIGLYDSGTAIGTSYLNDAISFRDRITVPDVKIYQSMIFDVTNRRVANGMQLYYDVHSLNMVRGTVKGQHGTNLIEGEDFEMDYDNNIFFPKRHLLGTNVSLNIETILRYIVIDLLKESRYQITEKNRGKDNGIMEELPRKLLLKREDIFISPTPFSLESNTSEVVNEYNNEQETTDNLINAKRQSNTSGFFDGRFK